MLCLDLFLSLTLLTPQQPEGDDIILEQLFYRQNSMFHSNTIAVSFPISSGHLNALIIYQEL